MPLHDLPSPSSVLEDLRAAREDDATRTSIEVKRWLAVLQELLPAALYAADAGNVTMRNAVRQILPLLPKPKTPTSSSL